MYHSAHVYHGMIHVTCNAYAAGRCSVIQPTNRVWDGPACQGQPRRDRCRRGRGDRRATTGRDCRNGARDGLSVQRGLAMLRMAPGGRCRVPGAGAVSQGPARPFRGVGASAAGVARAGYFSLFPHWRKIRHPARRHTPASLSPGHGRGSPFSWRQSSRSPSLAVSRPTSRCRRSGRGRPTQLAIWPPFRGSWPRFGATAGRGFARLVYMSSASSSLRRPKRAWRCGAARR